MVDGPPSRYAAAVLSLCLCCGGEVAPLHKGLELWAMPRWTGCWTRYHCFCGLVGMAYCFSIRESLGAPGQAVVRKHAPQEVWNGGGIRPSPRTRYLGSRGAKEIYDIFSGGKEGSGKRLGPLQ